MEVVINTCLNKLAEGYEFNEFNYHLANAVTINSDCFKWLVSIPDNSIDAIVTDPPYGIKEYDIDQINKKVNGSGGVWRIPPSFDGNVRSPLPRFTALSKKERERIVLFFTEFGEIVAQKLKPGGHMFLASNTFLSQMVFGAIVNKELEFRGEIIRLVRTMRGGDKPKLFEKEFNDVCTMPRACFEPWGLFRKKIPKGMKIGDCLKKYGTGGLRRISSQKPFEDVIPCTRTPRKERNIAKHPSLKPQSYLRKIVYASLPLGKGIVVDPFMGSGSTISACLYVGYNAIGVERHNEYYINAMESIPHLIQI